MRHARTYKGILMFPYDLSRDQNLLHASLGFERPMVEATKNFSVPGEVRHNIPRLTVAPEYEAFHIPCYAFREHLVPVIYMRSGYAKFGLAEWGKKNPSCEAVEYFRKCERRALGFPAVIPASFVDLFTDPTKTENDVIGVRLRALNGGLLYIGCTFLPDELNNAKSVALLVREPNENVAPYINWQPLFIPIVGGPSRESFDFISRHDNGWLQVPSAPMPVVVEMLFKQTA
jgi:hypothetical protein